MKNQLTKLYICRRKPLVYSPPCFCSIEDNDDDSKMADLLSYFQQQLTFQESVLKLCQPELESSQTHISGEILHLSVHEKYFNLRC